MGSSSHVALRIVGITIHCKPVAFTTYDVGFFLAYLMKILTQGSSYGCSFSLIVRHDAFTELVASLAESVL